jgi:putative ABC transport system permease protein
MIKNFFILAIRNLIKQKQTTLISILGLVIAFTVILQIGNWCAFELSYDKYQSKADRIYRFTVEESRPDENFYWHFARCWQPWRAQLPEFYREIETLVELRPLYRIVVKTNKNSFYTEQAFSVDSSAFHVFDFDFVLGNPQTALNGKSTVVISESFAHKLFPGENAINKSIILPDDGSSDQKDYTITGIYKDMPANSHFHAEMLVHYNKKPV